MNTSDPHLALNLVSKCIFDDLTSLVPLTYHLHIQCTSCQQQTMYLAALGQLPIAFVWLVGQAMESKVA